jgi:hypothetical protein
MLAIPRPYWLALLALVVAMTAGVRAEDAPAPATLEKELVKVAPKLIGYIQGKGFRNVGVLKFRVHKDGVVSDNVGPLNLAIARRLEVALALANDDDEQTQIGLIKDANGVAAGIKGASHLTAERRQKLFGKRYPLAWGDEEVEPDAFLTGVAELDPGLEKMKLHIIIFGRDEASHKTIQHLDVAVDPSLLVESGSSFLLRGGADGGPPKIVPEKGKSIPKEVKDAVAIAKQDAKKALAPEQGKPLPVTVEIGYGAPPPPGSKEKGKFVRVDLDFKDNRAVIPEPAEGQDVVLLIHRDNSKLRYGVVVMVNGENTLFKERLTPLDCTKWVLEPGQKPFAIRGFRTETSLLPFKVSSVTESKANEVNYGPDVGTISVVVYRESGGGEPPANLPADEEAVVRGLLPAGKIKDATALKEALRKGATDAAQKKKLALRGGGGLIESKEGVPASELERAEFIPDPIPIQSLIITYRK